MSRQREWLGWGWLYNLIGGMTADTAPVMANDYVAVRSASAGTSRKVALRYLGAGKQSCWVPATAMVTRTTNGAAAGSTESTTNKIMGKTYDFDQSTIEYVQFTVAFPKGWNEGTITARFVWRAPATGNVIWGIQGIAISDDDLTDSAFGTAQEVTDGVTATTDTMVSGETSAVTIGGTPAEGDLVVFQVYRNASDGADTVAADALLVGCSLFFTTNSNVDD